MKENYPEALKDVPKDQISAAADSVLIKDLQGWDNSTNVTITQFVRYMYNDIDTYVDLLLL